MLNTSLDHIAAGGNRHPSAADWAPGLLAFGAGNNVALWDPDNESSTGIMALLAGHTDVINAVKLFDTQNGRYVITGSADNSVRVWSKNPDQPMFKQWECLTDHKASINTIDTLSARNMFVTGSADGTMNVWSFDEARSSLVQSINLKPQYLPLVSALRELSDESILLAIAGTSSAIQLYVRTHDSAKFELQATLTGHESWIRSLDFIMLQNQDILLASASQDKYIRLWRFHNSSHTPLETTHGSLDPSASVTALSLSNKAHQVGGADSKYNVTFEALLVGHEDWIYTVRWAPSSASSQSASPRLLSASADNSLAIWEADEHSGVWICQTRLGEISAQKGSTTATGSTGGFWIGLWQTDAARVVSLGRTGSWRKWKHDTSSDTWLQEIGISGHTQEVRSIAWATDGAYLISVGEDQTARLFAQWKRGAEFTKRSWHEVARPQIHGYDLNCIDTLRRSQFISGADEKLLRVFNKPKAIRNLLARLSGSYNEAHDDSIDEPDTANIPVLGLSNKAVATNAEEEPHVNGTTIQEAEEDGTIDGYAPSTRSTLDLAHPPFEEHLCRHTLWPEDEKLYGHGYEISAVAASRSASIVATACKASSVEHAVIRLYETSEWREVKPALSAHSLTVTALKFSPDDQYLLSVGRDRQWAVFVRDVGEAAHRYKLLTTNPKGHSRMILDCDWAPSRSQLAFATAGRDKTIKMWRFSTDGNGEHVTSIVAKSAVTAIAFLDEPVHGSFVLAVGTEDGQLRIVTLHSESLKVVDSYEIQAELLPALAISSLKWRPSCFNEASNKANQLAVASNDTSVRIINLEP